MINLSLWLRLGKERNKLKVAENHKYKETVSEFNEFEPGLKSAKNRIQLSAGLNLKKLNTILSGTNYI